MPTEAKIAFMPAADDAFEKNPVLGAERALISRLSPPDAVIFDSIARKDTAPSLHPDWAVFNAAFFGAYFIARAVHVPSMKIDVPDVDVLVVVRETEKGRFERFPDLNLPIGVGKGEVINWEDPRISVLEGPGEPRALLGLTAVRIEPGGFVPHPALVDIYLENGELKVGGDVTVFNEVGKNTIPIGDKLIYRPEAKSHSFHLLVKPTAEHELALIKEIDFSNYRHVEWMSKKVGTVARPIDIGNNLRLLPIHGVRSGMGIDGVLKEDIYSVGFAILDRDWNIEAVSAEPMWRRKDFLTTLPLGQGINGEREKEVVYLDDWVKKGNTFEFPLNVGDRLTVIDRKNLSQLLNQKWIRFAGPADRIVSTTGHYEPYNLSLVEPERLPALAA